MVKKTFKLNLILTWYDRLKSVRKKTGLSQEVFAKEVTLSKQQVTRLETNNANPTPDFLKKLSELFDVNLNWFISGKGPEKLSHVIDENDLVYYPTESLENELHKRKNLRKIVIKGLEVNRTPNKIEDIKYFKDELKRQIENQIPNNSPEWLVNDILKHFDI